MKIFHCVLTRKFVFSSNSSWFWKSNSILTSFFSYRCRELNFTFGFRTCSCLKHKKCSWNEYIWFPHRSISIRTGGRWPRGRWLCWAPIGRHCGGRPPSWAAQAAASTSWRNTSDGLYCRNSNETLILLAASNILTPSVDIFMRVVPYAPHPLSLSEPMGVGVRSAVENFESEVTVQCA